MRVRSRPSTSSSLRRHWRPAAPRVDHRDEPAPAPPGPARAATPSSRNRRLGGQSQDQALYACACGHRFEALVSTSVDCPRCGGAQAW